MRFIFSLLHLPVPDSSLFSVLRFPIRSLILKHCFSSTLPFSTELITMLSGVLISCETPAIHSVLAFSLASIHLRVIRIGNNSRISIFATNIYGPNLIKLSIVSIFASTTYFHILPLGWPTTRIPSSRAQLYTG